MRLLGKKRTLDVLEILDRTYPDARPELNHSNPFEMLIATILSAQCTDVRVNMITEELFSVVKTPQDVLDLGSERIKEIIRPCGFYNTKTKSIMNTCQILVDEHNSEVPSNRKDLEKLPGVGRKTANVVLSTCFGEDAIAVDTHVFRVTNRIGIVDENNVEETEKALMKKIPKKMWTKAHHQFIFHGRRCCRARSPKCEICTVRDYCNYYKKLSLGKEVLD